MTLFITLVSLCLQTHHNLLNLRRFIKECKLVGHLVSATDQAALKLSKGQVQRASNSELSGLAIKALTE